VLDFALVRNKEIGLNDLCTGLTKGDLYRLTDEMVESMLDLIAGCTDADVTFVPQDPAANDPFAARPAEVTMPWTLGHVIVHTTASSEESAYLAAELARGVPQREGRSRHEVAWQTVRTVAQCRARLSESRWMRLASLDMWPAEPHLDNTFKWRADGKEFNAVVRFVLGLFHDDSHLGQIAEVVRQAKATRP
jgi:hypothetical protein